MAASQRKQNESYPEYRGRIYAEQEAINRDAAGVLIFQSTNLQLFSDGPISRYRQIGPGRTAHAIRDGKLNKKHGRRSTSGYRAEGVK